MDEGYDFFLGGVIQGSMIDRDILSQDYRERIKRIVAKKVPGRTLYCPVENHQASIDYDDAQAEGVFRRHIDLAVRCKFFIAYLPTASMGTAIEIWECRRAGVPVISVSPMIHNWIIRLFSAVVLPDLDEFEKWLSEDHLRSILNPKISIGCI